MLLQCTPSLTPFPALPDVVRHGGSAWGLVPDLEAPFLPPLSTLYPLLSPVLILIEVKKVVKSPRLHMCM